MSSDMPRTDPPEVMKRRVRTILRQERERLHITQRAAAERVLWSQSKLIRIETGVVPPSPADVRVLLLEYGVPDGRIGEIVEYAKLSRQPDDWEAYKDVYSAASRNLFANERAATLIEKYEPTLVPGLFQTEDYAHALLKATGSDPRRMARRIEGRLRRQGMLDSDDCPQLDVIIGEAAVSRPIGGYPTMLAQIERLKEIALHPQVTLRLMPFSIGAHPGLGAAFTVLQFRDADLPDLVYLESADRDTIVRDETEEVTKYNTRFADLADIAPPPEELPGLLDEIAKTRFGKH